MRDMSTDGGIDCYVARMPFQHEFRVNNCISAKLSLSNTLTIKMLTTKVVGTSGPVWRIMTEQNSSCHTDVLQEKKNSSTTKECYWKATRHRKRYSQDVADRYMLYENVTMKTYRHLTYTNCTTTTGTEGTHEFVGLPPSNCTSTESNPPKYPFDVSDYDTTPDDPGDTGFSPPDNKIPLIITFGKKDGGNNFVDTVRGTISGTVTEDIDNDGSGDTPLEGVVITLLDNAGLYSVRL
jgi:hypothetical protein